MIISKEPGPVSHHGFDPIVEVLGDIATSLDVEFGAVRSTDPIEREMKFIVAWLNRSRYNHCSMRVSTLREMYHDPPYAFVTRVPPELFAR